MSRQNPTRQQFLKDVEKHQMRVIQDNGIHRHLHFGVPGTSCMHFQILTFPGYLVYTGDMGSFIFQRTEDMFCFFRTSPARKERPYINEDYWAEKLEAHDKHAGHEKYEPDIFKRRVIEYFRDHCRDESLNHAARRELWEEVKNDVLSYADENEYEARSALTRFRSHGMEFIDTFEWDFTEYTYRYIWACHAIAWAVMQYDEAKNTTEAA